MKINRILLTDNYDNFYTDLIEFKKDTTREEVYEIIEECKNDLPQDYTNEDIYEYLDKKIGVKSIIFLGDYDKIYY